MKRCVLLFQFIDKAMSKFYREQGGNHEKKTAAFQVEERNGLITLSSPINIKNPKYVSNEPFSLISQPIGEVFNKRVVTFNGSSNIFGEVPYLFFEHEAVLMRPKLIVNHLMDLILQEGRLFLVQGALFFELASQCVLGDLEVVLHHHKRIMEDVFQYLHLLLDNDQLLLRVRVQGARSLD